MHEGPGSFKGQRAAYRTNLPQMVKTRATYTAHMPGNGQFLVQGHPQVPHSSGNRKSVGPRSGYFGASRKTDRFMNGVMSKLV